MQDMYGTYAGLMFSTESAVGLAEFRIVISEALVFISIAFDGGMDEHILYMIDATEMDIDEVGALFVEGDDADTARGFRFADGTTLVATGLGENTVIVLGGKPDYTVLETVAVRTDDDGHSDVLEQTVMAINETFISVGAVPRLDATARHARDTA